MKKAKSRVVAKYVVFAFIWSLLVPAGALAAPAANDTSGHPQIDNLADKALVDGTIEVRVSASQEGHIVLLIDGKIGAITNIAPYRFDLDTEALKEGAHTLQVQLYAANGEVISSKTKTILVRNGGTLKEETAQPKLEVKAPVVPSAPQLSRIAKSSSMSGAEQDLLALPETPRESEQAISLASTDTLAIAEAKPSTAAGSKKNSNWEMKLTAAPRKQSVQRVAAPEPAMQSSPMASAAMSEFALLPNLTETSPPAGGQLRPEPESSAVLLPGLKESEIQYRKPLEKDLTPALAVRKSLSAVSLKPSEPKKGLTHIVAKGESIWSIARQYGVDVSEITKINKLEDAAKLKIGQPLRIVPAPVISVESKTIKNGPMPFFSKGRLMVPIRAVVEACGGKVNWTSKDGTITINTSTTKIVMRVKQAWALAGGKVVSLEQEVALRENRTYAPFENLKELAVLAVRYEPQSNRVLIARLPH